MAWHVMLSVIKGDVSSICNLAAKFVLVILLRLGDGVEEVKPGRGSNVAIKICDGEVY